jgi:hypothetical protein
MMKKIAFFMTFFIVWSSICSFLGFQYAKKSIEPITITKYETQWKDKVIYRDYTKLPLEDIITDLKCYDTSEFKLDINKVKEPSYYRIDGSLCGRSAYKDVLIEANTSGNWKLYAGIGVAGIATGFAIYHFGR